MDIVKESLKVEQKPLPQGSRYRISELGIERWFDYLKEEKLEQLLQTIFVAQGKLVGNQKNNMFDIVYPIDSFMVNEGWGTSMWLGKGEYRLIEVKEPEAWL